MTRKGHTFSGRFLWKLQRSHIKQKNSQRGMYEKHQPKTDNKVPMPRFMAKQVHAQQATEASAEPDDKKQCFLGDTPFFLFGKPFVGIHKKQRKQIHTEEISRVKIEHIISPFGGVL